MALVPAHPAEEQQVVSLEGVDIKFAGIIQTINEAKKFGMVASEEAHAMWGQEVYAFKDVLTSCGAGVGDTIRFGVHISTRNQPQVSLPVFKVGQDGQPIGVPAGTQFVNCEDAIAEDPSLLERIKQEIEAQSQRQNSKKRKQPAGDGKGKSKGLPSMEAWGPVAVHSKGGDPWGGKGGGKGGKGDPWGGSGWDAGWGDGGASWGGDAWGGAGGGWGSAEVTLYVSGVPLGVPRRELLHIFRQYAGFSSLRQVEKTDHTLVFVSFATQAQAAFVAEALTGYVFDEEAPPETRSVLSLAPAKQKMNTRS